MNRYLKLLFVIPLSFLLLFVIMAVMPSSLRLPELRVLGNNSVINVVVTNNQHVFYIASIAPIESRYESQIANLKFTVHDTEDKIVEIDRHERFFLSTKANVPEMQAALTVHGGSVFRLKENVKYPMQIRIDSNISSNSGLFWAVSEGSFWPAIGVFLAVCFISGITIYLKWIRHGG